MLNDLKNTIIRSQRTQRNWDLSQSIKDEDLELFKIAVSNCPTKQNRIWYNVVFVKDRNVIEKIYNTTDGFTYTEKDTTTNSQTLANLLVVFCIDKDVRDKVNKDDTNNSKISIGIASGYLNLVAHILNYKTGYCACFDNKEVNKILDIENSELILGIGHPDYSKERREHHKVKDFLYPTFDKDIKVKII